jgi:integrase
VPEEHVEATCRRLSPQLVAMVQLLLHSGMRVGELLAMTADAIDIQADPWRYTPTEHKTAHHGIVRVIVLGPRARATLAPWLDPGEPWLFPTVAAARPIWRSRTGAPITANNFRRRVQRAAAAAGVPTWTPLQLRHTAATRVRRHLGLETARAVLGHTIATTTEIYAERDVQLAVDAMQLLG